MILLLAMGIAVSALGLLATGFGMPIKDTTFGNSVVLGGINAICSGLVLVGLALVVRELKAIAAALTGGAPQSSRPARPAAAAPSLPPLFPQRRTAGEADHGGPAAREAEPQPAAPPPWAHDSAIHAQPTAAASAHAPAMPAVEAAPGEPPPLAPLVMPPRPRRNLLFPSRRKEQPAPGLPEAAPVVAAPAPVAAPAAPTAPAAPPHLTFDAAWPAQADDAAHPAAATPPAAAETALPAGVTEIKSGVVDGMKYWLYSDGSIEAEMAEGKLRFASLEELRTYLSQRP